MATKSLSHVKWWHVALLSIASVHITGLINSLLIVCALLLVLSIYRYLLRVRKLHDLAGRRFIITPISVPSFLLPPKQFTQKWFFNEDPARDMDVDGSWKEKEKYGCTITSTISLIPGKALISVADPEAIQIIASRPKLFVKPTEYYGILKVFGPNLVTLEGEAWRRHRRIAAPAFSEANNALVWEEGHLSMQRWFHRMDASIDSDGTSSCQNITDLMMRVTLDIISGAAFGKQVAEEGAVDVVDAGHQLSFREALGTVTDNLISILVIPKWLLRMPCYKHFAIVRQASEELDKYFDEMIEERRTEIQAGQEKSDLFTLLLKPSSEKIEPMESIELKGSLFIFMVAGHETTAHGLAFTLGLLALYPAEQDKIYDEVRKLVDDHEDLTYAHYARLPYCIAVLYESLRLFPPLMWIPKRPIEDTTLPATIWNADGKPERVSVVVPEGCIVDLDVAGLHRNPESWGNDSLDFRPSRFVDTESYKWPRDSFIPWSIGQRNCIGMKFAQVESICVLANLIRNYKIELANTEETFEATKKKLLRATVGVTLTGSDIALKFRRR